jgi:hypothetical protein
MSSAKQHSKLDFYLRTAMAGGICASAAHTVLVPIDVVKTRIQVKESIGVLRNSINFQQIILTENNNNRS